MRQELQARCQLFVENRNHIKERFYWQSSYMHPLAASMFTMNNKQVDIDKLKDCEQLLKEKTGIFSNFRGTPKLAILTNLALSSNPEGKLDNILDLYTMLKREFWNSEFLVVTAIAIAETAKTYEYEEIIKRTRILYNRMKSLHPLLTSKEDIVFAALLAATNLSDTEIEEETEACYRLLKPYFFTKNGVQSLSHTLVLGTESTQKKCDRVLELYLYLREKGYKYGNNYELATIGVLGLLPVEIPVLAEEIIEVNDFLSHQKGFGVFGVGAKQRLMYAGLLVMCECIENQQAMQTAATQGVISLVIAQQIAMCASATAIAAAQSSNNVASSSAASSS